MLKSIYNYKPINRKTVNGKRHYVTPDGTPVASVTTILSATKPQADWKKLNDWKKRTDAIHGKGTAQKITKEAADRGTKMHTYLEEYCINDSIEETIKKQKSPRETILTSQGYKMANIVIDEGLNKLDECWAVEAPLYYSGLYAGTTDAVGIFEGTESIVDFKQSNKPKKREWIDDYFMQLCAYGEAHNDMFGTNIRSGVILMCTKDLMFQRFDLTGAEYDKYMHMWWDRVDQYYSHLRKLQSLQ